MANQKLSALTTIPAVDRVADLLYIVDVSGGTSNKTTINQMLGITGAPIGDTDTATMSNKTLTAPVISSPVLSGTVTGIYTLGGTPTFPSAVVTLTGSQTLTNKILTSPTINTATIVNPTLTVDTVSGFSVSNTGTVYGIGVTLGVITTASSVQGAALTNSSVTSNKLLTGATNATVATSETTTSTTYANLTTTTDSVTVTIGVNGIAIVLIQSYAANSTANAKCFVSVDISGANTTAASDAMSLELQVFAANAEGQLGNALLFTGLSAGSTTFKMKYRVDTGGSGSGTGTFKNRRIGVIPL
jgi:hypothetical protein